MRQIDREHLGELARRAMLITIAVLFVGTSVVGGIYFLWAATRSPTEDTTQTDSCPFDANQPASTLPAPEAFKPQGDVTQLSVTDLREGTGVLAEPGDCLTVKYHGSLASNGEVFDENFTEPTAIKFKLASGQVIPGWDEGLIGMKVGGERRLVIPSELAYGSQGQGPIPAGADLVFHVALLAVE